MGALADAIAQGITGAGLPWAETEMKNVGDFVRGTIIETDFRQAFNPETKQPAVWEKSGDAIMEVVIKVTGTGKFRADLDDDNGDRAFHIRWAFENKDAFIEAMNAAGVAEPEVGGLFAGQLVQLRPNGGVRKPTKLFRYEYKPPASPLAQAVAETNGSMLDDAPPPAETGPGKAAGNGNAAASAQSTQSRAAAQSTQSTEAGGSMLGDDDPWGTAPGTPLPTNTPPPPAAAPPAAAPPTAAPDAPADPAAQLATVKALIVMGMTDTQIIAATQVNPLALAAIRNIP